MQLRALRAEDPGPVRAGVRTHGAHGSPGAQGTRESRRTGPRGLGLVYGPTGLNVRGCGPAGLRVRGSLAHRVPGPGVLGPAHRPGRTVRSLISASLGRSRARRMVVATDSGSIHLSGSYSLPSCWWTLACMGLAVRPG